MTVTNLAGGKTTTTTDAELMTGLAAGHESALAALYDRHGGILYALAYRILSDREDAEEIVLTAFMQAWKDARGWQPHRGSVATWLVMMTRSRALDRLRSRKRRQQAVSRAAVESPGAPAMGEPGPPADASVAAADAGLQVRGALRELPDSQRTCIELAYYEGLSQSEIAARLKEPLGTVKTRMRLAMAKLRDLLRPVAEELRA